jgi:hypothetical protein
MTEIQKLKFENGILKIPNIKKVEGTLHERINKRHKTVMLRDFLLSHPMNESKQCP